MTRADRRLLLAAGALLVALAVAIPVLAASPSPTASSTPSDPAPTVAPASTTAPAPAATPAPTPASTPKPSKGPKDKTEKEPELDATVTGTVTQATDEDGQPAFAITSGGTTWTLSAGPAWFWGDKNPLKGFVGKSVTIVGSYETGSTELDVETVDGTAIRAPGKPPWAGGPWVVGKIHPGWKPWMADGKPGKGHGRETAPGQGKDEP